MDAVKNTTKNMVLKDLFMSATYLWKNWNIIGIYNMSTPSPKERYFFSSYYRILTMVYNFQKYWVFGLYPSSWY
jgi:hypothetical protein